jgi:Flp pilus assembly pilin Flp
MSGHLSRADEGGMSPSGWIGRLCRRREEGQTMAEYVVVLGMITIVTAVAFMNLGDALVPLINGVRAVFS